MTKKQERYIDYLAGGIVGMEEAEFIERVLRIKPEIAARWRRLPGFMEEVCRRARENSKRHFPGILEALCIRAKEGDLKAIEMYLKQGAVKPDHAEIPTRHVTIGWAKEI